MSFIIKRLTNQFQLNRSLHRLHLSPFGSLSSHFKHSIHTVFFVLSPFFFTLNRICQLQEASLLIDHLFYFPLSFSLLVRRRSLFVRFKIHFRSGTCSAFCVVSTIFTISICDVRLTLVRLHIPNSLTREITVFLRPSLSLVPAKRLLTCPHLSCTMSSASLI